MKETTLTSSSTRRTFFTLFENIIIGNHFLILWNDLLVRRFVNFLKHNHEASDTDAEGESRLRRDQLGYQTTFVLM